jgi:hypothetical protein
MPVGPMPSPPELHRSDTTIALILCIYCRMGPDDRRIRFGELFGRSFYLLKDLFRREGACCVNPLITLNEAVRETNRTGRSNLVKRFRRCVRKSCLMEYSCSVQINKTRDGEAESCGFSSLEAGSL